MKGPPRRPLAVRLYGALAELLPGELGRRFGNEVVDVFGELHRETVERRGRVAGWILWARSVASLVTCALREWGDERRRGAGRLRAGPRPSPGGGGGGGPVSGLLQDLRFAVRAFARRPGLALTAILILAAATGATTTIFSVVDTVVLRPLPYPDAGRLVHFGNGAHSYPSLRAWLGMSSFEAVAAVRDEQVHLTGGGPPERLAAVSVSPEFFRTFGGAPHMGRLFGPDDHPGDRSVAVLGHGLWERRWGGDPEVIGRTISIDGEPSVVIGVLDPAFDPPELNTGSRVDVWFALGDGGEDADEHGWHALGVMARLGRGVSLQGAQAEVDAQRRLVAEAFPDYYVQRDGSVRAVPLVPLREATVGGVRSTLLTLLGAVGLMLLVGCANVADLFLAHGTSRGREMALRAALGAGRTRIAAQVLSECVLLALVGGALGVAVAFGGVELFRRLDPGGIPRMDRLAVDLRVLAFSGLVATGTGVLFGVLPALKAVRADVGEALKEGAGSATQGQRRRRLRSGLVVAELALTVVLVTGAGLLLRSFVARVQVDPGFRTEGLVVVPLTLGAGYDGDRRLQFADALLERTAALPGVRGATAGWTSPFKYTGGSRCCWRTRVVGDPALHDEDDPFLGVVHPVTPGYFATLGAPLAHGREFNRADHAGGARVAVLNLPAARELFGSPNAVGRTLALRDEPLEVVGVVEGVHHWGLTEGVEGAVYVPYAVYGAGDDLLDVVVWSDAATEVVAPALRSAIWAVDPDLPVPEVVTMERRVSGSLATPRFLSGLMGAFAVVALVLACGGIYGSMLHMVGQRRREMGIRLALGAGAAEVVRLVMTHAMIVTALGVALGLLGGWSLSGVVERLLWGVGPTDPVTFAAVAVLLTGAALSAAFVPAWRAGRTDPVRTLKTE